MTTQLNPYLILPGTAAQAIAFYADVFGGTPEVMTFADVMPGAPNPEGVMHAYLAVPGGSLMISDGPPGEDVPQVQGIACSLSGDDEAALTGWWDQLSESGEVHVPFEKAPWGDTFGQCRDRFGVLWMVNVAGGTTA